MYDFFGPKWQTSLDFQGPPLPMPLVMDLARLKTITYRAISVPLKGKVDYVIAMD
jgi:hypothetical protein